MTAYLLLKTYMEYHVSWSYRGKSCSLIENKADQLFYVFPIL